MPKRSSTPDINQIAASVVEVTTNGHNGHVKNASAVALGRLGGLKGGKARAAKLTKQRRSEIARQGAMGRWNKKT